MRNVLERMLVLGGVIASAAAFADAAHAGLPAIPAASATTPPASAPALPTTPAPVVSTPAPVVSSTPAPVVSSTPAVSAPAAPASSPAVTPTAVTAAATQPAATAASAAADVRAASSSAAKTASDLAGSAAATAHSAASDVTTKVTPLVEAAHEAVNSTAAPLLRSTTEPLVRLSGQVVAPTATRISNAIRTSVVPSPVRSSSSPPTAMSARNVTETPRSEAIVTTARNTVQRAPPQPRVWLKDLALIPWGDSSFVGGTMPAGAVVSGSRGDSPGGRVPQRPPPLPPPGSSVLAGTSTSGGGGLLLFGLLAFAFLLAIPTAVRWLRPALALGLSPAYVAPGDRPG